MSKLTDTIKKRQNASSVNLVEKRLLWDKCEKLFHNQLASVIAKGAKSQVFDPKLATLILERGYRVMNKLGTGKVRGISKNDAGDSALMNLVVDKYVIPNANAQFDFLTKSRMANIYSNVYGNFFALIDWDVKPNGYVGPDWWLLNIRDVFHQVGAVSLEDSDYVIVRSWKPLSYFENLDRKAKGYKNIDLVLEKLKGATGDKTDRDKGKDVGQREQEQYPEQIAAEASGFFEVWSQYERDRWVDYCVRADLEFRDFANPHDNGELPVECKYSIPLLDDFMGMGDAERGAPMQMVTNSIWNLYLDAVKMSIFPPVLLNKDNIASMASIKWGAAEKWLGRGQLENMAKTLNLTPKGIRTFQGVYQVANSSLLNMFGTTDTSVTAQVEPGFGRTPKALTMQESRQNSRDSADSFYQEQFVKKVIKKMVNLISKKQPKAITLRLFEEDIKELKQLHPDLAKKWDEKTGKLSVGKKVTGSTLWDYEIVSGSMYAVDEQAQQKNLVMLMEMLMKFQTPQGNLLLAQLEKEGFDVSFGEIFKRVIAKSGVQDWSKIIGEKSKEDKDKAVLDQHAKQFMALLQGGQVQPGMNQIPPQKYGQTRQRPGA